MPLPRPPKNIARIALAAAITNVVTRKRCQCQAMIRSQFMVYSTVIFQRKFMSSVRMVGLCAYKQCSQVAQGQYQMLCFLPVQDVGFGFKLLSTLFQEGPPRTDPPSKTRFFDPKSILYRDNPDCNTVFVVSKNEHNETIRSCLRLRCLLQSDRGHL